MVVEVILVTSSTKADLRSDKVTGSGILKRDFRFAINVKAEVSLFVSICLCMCLGV